MVQRLARVCGTFAIRAIRKPIAYYIQAPNENTTASCSTINGKSTCLKGTMNDYVEFDDRGYIYAADRAGSGVTILSLAGDALKVVAAPAKQPDSRMEQAE